jgi:hypothetical protein
MGWWCSAKIKGTTTSVTFENAQSLAWGGVPQRSIRMTIFQLQHGRQD